MKTFFCGYYFDRSAEEFVLSVVRTDRDEAARELDAVSLPEGTHRTVVEMSFAGLKKHLLDCAIEDAKKVAPFIGRPSP